MEKLVATAIKSTLRTSTEIGGRQLAEQLVNGVNEAMTVINDGKIDGLTVTPEQLDLMKRVLMTSLSNQCFMVVGTQAHRNGLAIKTATEFTPLGWDQSSPHCYNPIQKFIHDLD